MGTAHKQEINRSNFARKHFALKKPHPLLLSVLGGGLLWASWPMSPFTFLIFLAFVPFFWLEQRINRNRRFFYAVFLGMLLWNAACTWWVCLASLPGGIVAMLFSSTVMSLPWLFYRLVKKKTGDTGGYAALVAGWLSFEYIYLNIQLSWPWLTVGNVFALRPNWVQWYEYTGSSGGSFWVLLVNLFVFHLIKTWLKTKRMETREDNIQRQLSQRAFGHLFRSPSFYALLILLIIPFGVSYLISENHRTVTGTGATGARQKNVAVVQPNIDPYGKFDAHTQHEQLEKLIQLSESVLDENTRLLVWPETALAGISGFNEERIGDYPSLAPLWNFLRAHPQTTLYTGIETYRIYPPSRKTPSSHKIPDSENYFDAFNSATLLNAGRLPVSYLQPSQQPVFYHKSKLVPGVEMLPTYLRFLDKWFESFGGTSGGYAGQEDRTVLEDSLSGSGYKIAPAICYESVYGEFLTAYVRKGANVIGIITNDGWWGNTPGYRQHNQYARLRAIETRRWVIRSANTGISCFIDPRGNLVDPQPWDTATAIKHPVPAETRLTYFVRQGDYISKAAFGAAGILLFISFLPLRRIKRASHEEKSHL